MLLYLKQIKFTYNKNHDYIEAFFNLYVIVKYYNCCYDYKIDRKCCKIWKNQSKHMQTHLHIFKS